MLSLSSPGRCVITCRSSAGTLEMNTQMSQAWDGSGCPSPCPSRPPPHSGNRHKDESGLGSRCLSPDPHPILGFSGLRTQRNMEDQADQERTLWRTLF